MGMDEVLQHELEKARLEVDQLTLRIEHLRIQMKSLEAKRRQLYQLCHTLQALSGPMAR